MITWLFAWINASKHNDSWLILVSNERISQNHCEFSLSKRNMTSWNFTVHRSDAFFKSEKRFIDFSSFSSTLFVVVLCVLSSFTSCKINEQQSSILCSFLISILILSNFVQTDCAYCMRSRRSIVWSCCMGLSNWRSKLN